MIGRDSRNTGILVQAERRVLADVSAVNPLVARGIADLTTNRLLDVNGAIRPNYDRSRAYVNSGSILLFKNEFDRAIADYNEAISNDPNCAPAYNLRGLAWYYQQDFNRAIADYSEAIRLYPRCAGFYNNRGVVWRINEDHHKACQDFDEAIRLDPNNGDAYKNRAILWWDQNEYQKAIKDFDEAIRLDSNNAAYYYARGQLWHAGQKFEKAIRDFDEAIRLDPNPDVYSHRATAWIEKRDYEKAIKDFENAINCDYENESAYWSLAIAYIEKRATLFDRRNAVFYYNRGIAWQNAGEHEKAIQDYDQVIRLDPDDKNAYESLAWLLATCPEANARDGNRAVKIGTTACELTGWKSGWELEVLAAGYAETGQFDEAQRYQRKALEDPGYQELAGHESRERLELYKRKRPFRNIT